MVTKHILNDLVEYCGRLRLEVDSHNDEAFKYILEIEILSEKLLKEVKEEEERNENILEEAENALKLWEMLRPGLKVKKNGRVDTAWGDKTPLGLYRTIGSHIFS